MVVYLWRRSRPSSDLWLSSRLLQQPLNLLSLTQVHLDQLLLCLFLLLRVLGLLIQRLSIIWLVYHLSLLPIILVLVGTKFVMLTIHFPLLLFMKIFVPHPTYFCLLCFMSLILLKACCQLVNSPKVLIVMLYFFPFLLSISKLGDK